MYNTINHAKPDGLIDTGQQALYILQINTINSLGINVTEVLSQIARLVGSVLNEPGFTRFSCPPTSTIYNISNFMRMMQIEG